MRTKLIFKYLCVMVLTVMIFASCRKIDVQSFTAENPVIDFNQKELRVANTLDTIEVNVSSNLPWRLKSNATWMTLIKANGNPGEKAKIAIQRNRTDAERMATIIAYITSAAESSLVIIQAAGDPLPNYTRNFYVKVDGNIVNDGLSWEKPTTLTEALNNAVSGDVIHLAAGSYVPSKLLTGASSTEDRTFEITQNVSLIGGYPTNSTTGATANPSLYKSTLSGQLSSSNAYHVLTITALKETNKKVSISGITIEKGKAAATALIYTINGVSINRAYGGGAIVAGSVVEFNNVRISNNESALHAAGVFITGGATVTFRNSSVSNNIGQAETSNCGGIWNDASDLYMYDSEVTGNKAGGVGGGLYSLVTGTGKVPNNYLFNVTIANNEVGSTGVKTRTGAGIYAREKSQFTLINCTVYGNKTNGTASGGGITLYGASTVNLINSTVFGNIAGDNSAASGGSGLYNNGANTLNIHNSIISGNTGMPSDVFGTVSSSKSSIMGNVVYNANGDVVSGQSFDQSSAFLSFANYGGFGSTMPLKATAGSAISGGMSVLQLQILASNLSLPETYFIIDQNNKSRANKTVIGAAISQ